jgi:hypothetical protein
MKAIRQAISDTVAAANPAMNCYRNVQDVANLPAFIVGPPKGDFSKSMSRGVDEWTFELYVLVGIATIADAQDDLDQYVTGAGSLSIREILWNAPTLGGTCDNSMVMSMKDYGATYAVANIPHIGACLELVAYTSGIG